VVLRRATNSRQCRKSVRRTNPNEKTYWDLAAMCEVHRIYLVGALPSGSVATFLNPQVREKTQ
jgi:hypothetical protein